MLTAFQKKEILSFVEKKVSAVFRAHNVRAHDLAHTKRVRNWSVKIARAEKADIFLCELVAWLHDIGRTKEKSILIGQTHHELSYQMCRHWFKKEPLFRLLTKRQKLEILYAVRYHWNDAADKYQIAWILRDADKLDTLGEVGVKRSVQYAHGNADWLKADLRFKYQTYYWLHAKTARKIVKDKKLMEPVDKFLVSFLKKGIKPVAL